MPITGLPMVAVILMFRRSVRAKLSGKSGLVNVAGFSGTVDRADFGQKSNSYTILKK